MKPFGHFNKSHLVINFGVIDMGRVLNFSDGQSSATTPLIEGTTNFKQYANDAAYASDVGSPVGGAVYYNTTLDVVQYYNDSSATWVIVGQGENVTASRGTPEDIVAGSGISPLGVYKESIYIQGSGGAVDISANPQISAGTNSGDELILICVSDTNTIQLDDGDGLSLNGSFLMVNNSVIKLKWDGSTWLEQSRRD